MSRSPVALGLACNARAQAPTTRKRTSAAAKACNRSTKSWFIVELTPQSPQLFTQPPRFFDALSCGEFQPELPIRYSLFGFPADPNSNLFAPAHEVIITDKEIKKFGQVWRVTEPGKSRQIDERISCSARNVLVFAQGGHRADGGRA